MRSIRSSRASCFSHTPATCKQPFFKKWIVTKCRNGLWNMHDLPQSDLNANYNFRTLHWSRVMFCYLFCSRPTVSFTPHFVSALNTCETLVYSGMDLIYLLLCLFLGVQSIAIRVLICLSVCSHISKSTRLNLT